MPFRLPFARLSADARRRAALSLLRRRLVALDPPSRTPLRRRHHARRPLRIVLASRHTTNHCYCKQRLVAYPASSCHCRRRRRQIVAVPRRSRVWTDHAARLPISGRPVAPRRSPTLQNSSPASATMNVASLHQAYQLTSQGRRRFHNHTAPQVSLRRKQNALASPGCSRRGCSAPLVGRGGRGSHRRGGGGKRARATRSLSLYRHPLGFAQGLSALAPNTLLNDSEAL